MYVISMEVDRCIEILTIYILTTYLLIIYLPIYFNKLNVKYVLNKHVHNNKVSHKVLQLGVKMANFSIIGHEMHNWEWIFLQNEIIGTQISFSTNFGGKLNFIMSFLFPWRLHCSYIYFHCSYLYKYYNYFQMLYIKCLISTFDTKI
jgi:hypothetical protein